MFKRAIDQEKPYVLGELGEVHAFRAYQIDDEFRDHVRYNWELIAYKLSSMYLLFFEVDGQLLVRVACLYEQRPYFLECFLDPPTVRTPWKGVGPRLFAGVTCKSAEKLALPIIWHDGLLRQKYLNGSVQ